MDIVCMLRAVVVGLVVGLAFSFTGLLPVAWAFEEGKMVQKDDHWEFAPADVTLNLLLQKDLITRKEYDLGIAALAERERLSTPPFHINYNQGLNIYPRGGVPFFLKLRGVIQYNFLHHAHNDAWSTIGDVNNSPFFVGGRFQPRTRPDETSLFANQAMRIKFLGYVFDPNIRFNITLGADRRAERTGGAGPFNIIEAYVDSWHVPWANVVIGQHKPWFSRTSIQSLLNMSFVDRMIVQNNLGSANAMNRRDIGLLVLSNENLYDFNYAIGVYNGTGITLDRMSDPGDHNPNSLMFVARGLWNVMGRPGYGEGDMAWSRTPQIAIGGGYANNPGVNLGATVSPRVRSMMLAHGQGRLLGAGTIHFQTWNADFIARYRGLALQAEWWYRKQQLQEGPARPPGAVPLGDATGWYAMLGYFVVPRKLEVAARYGVFDPSTGPSSNDLIKEAGVALSYSFDGTYDHRVVVDFQHITMGTGGFSASPDFRGPLPVRETTQDLISNGVRIQYHFQW